MKNLNIKKNMNGYDLDAVVNKFVNTLLFEPGAIASSGATWACKQLQIILFREDLIMKTFLWLFSHFYCSKESSCQLLA